MNRLRIGCAVVTHNSAEVIEGLLASVHRLAPAKVVIVDHASSDRTLEILEAWRPPFDVRILRRPNRGYAAGVNDAVAALRDSAVEIVAVLNPDAQVLTAELDELTALFAARPDLGSVCPLTLADDGHTVNTLGLRLTPWAAVADHGQGEARSWAGTSAIPGVIGPCGGSAIYRTAALASVPGPLDERFFLYFEDADLALRLAAQGWSTLTTDLVTVRHRRAGLGGHADDLASPGARLAAVERQRSYALFVSDAARLPLSKRVVGRVAARLRGSLVRRRLRRAERSHV